MKDPWITWDHMLQIPLQPLSSNLSATTYDVSEADPNEYILYRRAIIQAARAKPIKSHVLPDRLIELHWLAPSIPAIELLKFDLDIKYIIFSLDKSRYSIETH